MYLVLVCNWHLFKYILEDIHKKFHTCSSESYCMKHSIVSVWILVFVLGETKWIRIHFLIVLSMRDCDCPNLRTWRKWCADPDPILAIQERSLGIWRLTIFFFNFGCIPLLFMMPRTIKQDRFTLFVILLNHQSKSLSERVILQSCFGAF